MRFRLNFFVLSLFFVSAVSAQTLTREQKLQKISELNGQIKILETDVLLPDAKDLKQSEREGFAVFRLMPREKYDHKLTITGGGAYYSFVSKTSEYGRGSDISLEQNYLSVGFAGADYGFIYDFAEIPLADVSKNNSQIEFIINYRPPTDEIEVRNEARKFHNYEINGTTYKSRVPAAVGHTYILRSISFDRSDILVALKIQRKDADGSLIIFWKTLENFEKPTFERSSQ